MKKRNTINVDNKNEYDYEDSLSGINSIIGRHKFSRDKMHVKNAINKYNLEILSCHE